MRIARTVSFSALGTFLACPVASWIQRVWQVPEELVAPGNGSGTGRRVGDLFHLAAARWYAGQTDGLPDVLFLPEDGDDVRDGVRGRWGHFVTHECAGWTPDSVERRISFRHTTVFGDLDVNGFIDLVLPSTGAGVVLADLKTNYRLDDEAVGEYGLQLTLYRLGLVAAGEAVSDTGLLIHSTPDGVETIPVSLSGCEPRLRVLLDDYAGMVSRGVLPYRAEGKDCGGCGYRALCPRASDCLENATAVMAEEPDLELFDEAWRPLVLALAGAGYAVEPGDEIRDGAKYLGMSVGAAVGPEGRTILLDADDSQAGEALTLLHRTGARAVTLRCTDGLAVFLEAQR